MKLIVKHIDINWKNEYPVFAKKEYLNIDSFDYNWIGGFIDENIKYILAYKVNKKYIFKIVTFLTSVICIDSTLDEKYEKIFLNEVVLFLNRLKFDFITQPPTHVVFNIYPDNSINTEFGSYVINLNESEENLWINLHQKHRNVIRNAQKKGVKIKNGNKYFDIAYELYKNTLARSNLNCASKDKMKKIIDNLNKNVEVFIAYYNNEIQGCAIIPYSKFSAYYIYGGSIEKPVTGAVNLLHWEAIKYFKSKDVKFYDFVGARIDPIPGTKYYNLQKFKSRFGGELKKGYLWKMPLNRFKYYLYTILYKFKNRSGDIIDQENKRKKSTSNF